MVFLLNKREGISSFRAIKEFARENNIKKIGHTGTLDPMASGALLIATDDDTKLIPYLKTNFKTYKVILKLGYTSDTYDKWGKIKKGQDSSKITIKTFTAILNSFKGKLDQQPPIYSAKKVNGVRAYKLARENKEVILKSSIVYLKKITDIRKISNVEFGFTITVSQGFYVRSLVHDIGLALKTGAIMTYLFRSGIEKLTIKDKILKIDVADIINIPIKKINKNQLENLSKGLKIQILTNHDLIAIEYKKAIVGIVHLQNKLVVSQKLFGNRIAILKSK